MGYEMVRSELTTTSIETGKKFDGKLFYDPRFGQSEIRSTGFITRNLLDAGGNWTDFGIKHLDEETRASWKEIATRDIIATYEKASGRYKKFLGKKCTYAITYLNNFKKGFYKHVCK